MNLDELIENMNIVVDGKTTEKQFAMMKETLKDACSQNWSIDFRQISIPREAFLFGYIRVIGGGIKLDYNGKKYNLVKYLCCSLWSNKSPIHEEEKGMGEEVRRPECGIILYILGRKDKKTGKRCPQFYS